MLNCVYYDQQFAKDSVRSTVDQAVQHWEEEIRKAKEQQEFLAEAVERIIALVKEVYPNAQ